MSFDPSVPIVRAGEVSEAERRALEEGALAVRLEGVRRYRLTGPGRVECLQGLVTCDVEQAGEMSHSFGALLTNKGMIVALLRITRLADEIIVEAPEGGAPAVEETFAKSLPPRLCRWEDVTSSTTGVGLYGPGAGRALGKALGARSASPRASSQDSAEAGRPEKPGVVPPNDQARRVEPVTVVGSLHGGLIVAGAVARGAPGLELVVPAPALRPLLEDLRRTGTILGGPALLEECRILAGIPRLGAETDDKTLPQEVRLEELGGVSYTKGCYLGQETVARVHFRGHPNRRLVAVALERVPEALPLQASHDGKTAGRITSAAWSEEVERCIALAVLRREVPDGCEVEVLDEKGLVRENAWLREP
jgi:folate-binding protein YgfZ